MNTTNTTDNIWIAVGDETGAFDEKKSNMKSFHGAAMILAKQNAFQDAFQQILHGKTIQQILSNSIEGLSNNKNSKKTLNSLADLGVISKNKNQHHVLDVWNYLKNKKIFGEFHINNIPKDANFAPLYNLCETLKWLIQQKEIISVGIYAHKAKDIMQNFTNNKDAAYILGALYGKMLGLVAPFLGDNVTIIAFPGLRSENIYSQSIKNSGQTIEEKYIKVTETGELRAGGNITGGNRAMENGINYSFNDTIDIFNKLNTKTKCDAKILVRRLFNDRSNVSESTNLLTNAVNFACKSNGSILAALADLSCALMRFANEKVNPMNSATIKIPQPIGNNIHFWNINDII